MRTLIMNGLVYRNESRGFAPMDILVEDGAIAALGNGISAVDARIIDAKGKRIVPGLVDVHTHGICGYDFLIADEKALQEMAVAYCEHGVTCVMPTLASAPLEEMLSAAKRIKELCATKGAQLCGVHTKSHRADEICRPRGGLYIIFCRRE